jgi:hypothetical protein
MLLKDSKAEANAISLMRAKPGVITLIATYNISA